LNKGEENPVAKKKNNVWGSVLLEQDLTQTFMKSGAVDKVEIADSHDRDVESYDFTKSYEDSRPYPDEQGSDEEQNDDIADAISKPLPIASSSIRPIIDYNDTVYGSKSSQPRGRKRKAESQSEHFERKTGGIHGRLGVKKLQTTKLGDITLTEEMDAETVTKEIAEFLHEAKVELIGTCNN